MLDVGSRRGDGADDRAVEGAARRRDQAEEREARGDLEPARAEVPVRDPVAEEVRDRSRDCGAASGAARRSERGARRDVQRDDQLSMWKTWVGSIR
jgi:hypothetical protein